MKDKFEKFSILIPLFYAGYLLFVASVVIFVLWLLYKVVMHVTALH